MGESRSLLFDKEERSEEEEGEEQGSGVTRNTSPPPSGWTSRAPVHEDGGAISSAEAPVVVRDFAVVSGVSTLDFPSAELVVPSRSTAAPPPPPPATPSSTRLLPLTTGTSKEP